MFFDEQHECQTDMMKGLLHGEGCTVPVATRTTGTVGGVMGS